MIKSKCGMCGAEAEWLIIVEAEINGRKRKILFDIRDVKAQERVVSDVRSTNGKMPLHRQDVTVSLCWNCIKKIAETELENALLKEEGANGDS